MGYGETLVRELLKSVNRLPATFSKLSLQNKSLQKANVAKLRENIFTLRISNLIIRLGCSLSY